MSRTYYELMDERLEVLTKGEKPCTVNYPLRAPGVEDRP